MPLDKAHSELKDTMRQYLKGDVSAATLKHASAPLGIYQQRNDLFMIRLRITAGHLALADLRTVAKMITDNDIGYAHLTTRQDIQLQDVPAERVCEVVRTCTANGRPVRGGGGNTFRNVAVSPDSGISVDSVFDVMPYARSLNDIILTWDRAFQLPRKLKIGFFDTARDERAAVVQDLGFLAKIVDGEPGFMVYGGGGMGRESALGVTLFDFLPAGQVPRCALAMTELFYDHGNRENRNRARIRFIVKRLGKERFGALFQEYFAKVDPREDSFPAWQLDLTAAAAALPVQPAAPADEGACQSWVARAVSPTRFGEDIVSARIFVPGGDLTAAQLHDLVALAELCGNAFVRLTPTQDVLLPMVRRANLATVYTFLKDAFGGADLLLESFSGHVVTCVGSTVCKIGILNSPAVGAGISERLDQLFCDHPDLDPGIAARVLDAIRVSGCPNSCGGQMTARIGLQGRRTRIDGVSEPVYRIFIRPDGDTLELSTPQDSVVPEGNVPEAVCALVRDMIVK